MRAGTLRSLFILLTTAVLVGACGGASPSPLPAQAAATPRGTSWPATVAPSSPASVTPTSAAPPGPISTPSVLTLSGTWVHPRADERLTSYAITLSAKPSWSGAGGTTLTEVVFSAAWADAPQKTMCTATEPGRGGAWSCRASLLALGVPPGKVTFSFDVHGVGVPAARSPDGLRRVTYAVPPPRPTNTDLTQIRPPSFENGDNTGTYRVDWSAPAGYADEFLVYYTEECPRPSTAHNAGKPCFGAGTPVDVSQLELLAKTPGEARTARVRVQESQCEGIHGSVLLRARNAYGNSTFAIVLTEPVLWIDPDSGDLIC